MSRNLGTLKERNERCAESRRFVEQAKTYRVFVCDCDDFECRCDERADRYSATVRAVNASEAARQFSATRLPVCVYVVVEDENGNRSSVAFTRDGEPLRT